MEAIGFSAYLDRLERYHAVARTSGFAMFNERRIFLNSDDVRVIREAEQLAARHNWTLHYVPYDRTETQARAACESARRRRTQPYSASF